MGRLPQTQTPQISEHKNEEQTSQPEREKRKMEETITQLKPTKRQRQSRRITLRTQKKRYISYLRSMPILHTTPLSRQTHHLHCAHQKTLHHCTTTYGLAADPNLTHWTNLKNKIKTTPVNNYLNNIINLTYHNLCIKYTPPPGTKQLLGLGPKFIPKRAYPNPSLLPYFNEFQHDARLKYTFAGTEQKEFTKNHKKIYIKSSWIPPTGNDDFESRL